MNAYVAVRQAGKSSESMTRDKDGEERRGEWAEVLRESIRPEDILS